MRFDRVCTILTDPDRARSALGATERLLRPGATVSVIIAPPADLGPHHDPTLADTAEVLEAQVRAWAKRLHETQVRFADAPLGQEVRAAELTVVEQGTSLERRYELVSLDRPVLLAEHPLDGHHLGFVVWGVPSGSRGLAHLARRAPPDAHLHVFQVSGEEALEVDVLQEVLGLAQRVEVSEVPWSLTGPLLPLRQEVDASPVDLVALSVPRGPKGWVTLGLAPMLGTAVLLVPDILAEGGPDAPIALFDALEVGDAHRTVAVRIDALGGVSGLDSDDPVAVVSGGSTVGVAQADRGRVRTDAHPVTAWGLSTGTADDAAPDAIARVARPEGADVALVGASTPRAAVRALREDGFRVWVVASDWIDPRSLRQRTSATRVLHLAAILDTPVLPDLPAAAHAAMLLRAARHLSALGVPVRRLGRDPFDEAACAEDAPFERRLEARCAATPTHLLDLTWDTDNAEARRHMLAMIGDARQELLFQVYMFEEDAIGTQVAQALARAASRGVRVRVLVDALWSRHEALGQENPLLTRLAAAPGVTLRTARPVRGLRDLKLRDHRKVIIADNHTAIVAGRNVAAHYLTGFDEAHLTPQTAQHLVPWLDLSTRVRGSVAGVLREGFVQAWAAAGGQAIGAMASREDRGTQPVWVVQHQGLTDANTLEATRALIDEAQSTITLVNTFPLQFELRERLLRALARGVRVRVFTGHVRPRYAGGAQPFPGGAGRDLATELVHGRWDPLVSAGADVYAVGLSPKPAWAEGVGVVLPHVHGKWISVDGTWFASGSANLDISSTYWESEVMLVGRSPDHVAAVETWLDGFVPKSLRFDPDDDGWKQRAQWRAWMAENWPALLS